jgi:glycosyltransferase involved in cell wall biosynthesis
MSSSTVAMGIADVAVVILTFNEEVHVGRAIESVRGFARQIFVIDSFSTDRTTQIAEAAGATVLRHRFVNQAQQFQWALDNAPITSAWTMKLDADELVEPALARELSARLASLPDAVAGVNLRLKRIFMDRWIRWGGRSHLLLRLWRTGKASIEQRWMDEHVVLREGSTTSFDGSFRDHNLRGIGYFIEKHNHYATREAVEILNGRYGFFESSRIGKSASTAPGAYLKRAIKERFYNRLPFFVAAPAYFIFRYLLQLGFLDGRAGLAYHFLQAFWYRFLVGVKVWELDMAMSGLRDDQARIALLANLTGLKLHQHPERSLSGDTPAP